MLYRKVFDRSGLPAIVGHYAILGAMETDIKNAYRYYVRFRGRPTIIPLTTNDAQKAALLAAYENRPVAAGLNWIDLIYYNGLASCPFCGGDGARTIEHYLPKSCYPEFAVFSLNLMPSCGGCNTKRNDMNSYGAPEPLLHPYFDKGLLDRISLYMHITVDNGLPEFGPLGYDAAGLDEEQIGRVDHHIDSSVDEINYYNKCRALFSDFRLRAKRWSTIAIFRTEVVVYEFNLCKEDGDVNSWRYAFYHGINKLSDDDLSSLVQDVLGAGPVLV